MLIINTITDTAGTILWTIAEAIVMGTTIVAAMTVEATEAIAVTIEAIVRMKRYYVEMLAMIFRTNHHHGCHVRQTEQFRCLILRDCVAKFGVATQSRF